MVKITKNITNKIAGSQASKNRNETRIEVISEVNQRPAKQITKKATTGKPNLPVKGTLTWKVFNEKLLVEYKRLVLGRNERGSRADYQNRRTQIFSIDKIRVIKPLISDQIGTIQSRFPQVKESELVEHVYNILQTRLRKITSSMKGIKWIDTDEFEVTGNRDNFRVIQEKIIKPLKRELREEAFNIIDRTKRELSSSQQLTAGITLAITGTDIRASQFGGDIRKSDTEISDGNIILRGEKALDNERLRNIGQRRKTGLEIGHTFGPGIGNIVAFAGLEEEPSFFMSFFSSEAQARLIELREAAIKVDANTKIEFALGTKIGKRMGSVSITIAESQLSNATSGGALQSLVTEVREIVRAEFATIISTFEASQPILDQVIQSLLYQYTLINKPKNTKSKKSYKASTKISTPIPVFGAHLKAGKQVKGAKSASTTPSSNLSSMIALINRKLHDQIKENMGKGKSKETLNYRTGRFAKSARVEALYDIKEKNAVGARVKYMRNPYGTFEPGGRLYKPGRDPHRIFGRSIRQILQEERIANLRRVKVDLGG